MTNFREYVRINEQVNIICESEQTFFTDEQIEKAEYYDIQWNPVSANIDLRIFDEGGNGLGSVEFEDADLAIEYIETIFELDEEDRIDLNSYKWASSAEDRVYHSIQDD